MLIFFYSKGLSSVQNGLRTVKLHLFIIVFSSSFELPIVPFLFVDTLKRESAEGGDIAGGVMSSEPDHIRVLRDWHVQSQFENPYDGVRA